LKIIAVLVFLMQYNFSNSTQIQNAISLCVDIEFFYEPEEK